MFSLTSSARGVGGENFSEREFVESRLVQKFFFQFCWRLSRGSEFARYILLFFAFGFVFIRSRLQFVGYCGEVFWGREVSQPLPRFKSAAARKFVSQKWRNPCRFNFLLFRYL